MTQEALKEKNKHQLRSEETQAKILDAAEVIFSERGFEKTQLEEIAVRAGFTRGAIYAHYAGKAELFLALMENRMLATFSAMRRVIEAEAEISKRPGIFKRWISTQVSDPTLGTLILEFKLYALRRPQSREKLQRLYDLMFKGSRNDFIELLFGHLDTVSRTAVERRLAIMGAILSAVILESHFRTKLLPKPYLQAVLDEVFTALIRA